MKPNTARRSVTPTTRTTPHMFAAAFLIATAAAIPATYAQAQGAGVGGAGRAITAADVLRLRSISSVEVASNGAFAAYTVRSVHTSGSGGGGAPSYEYRSHLWMVDLDDPDAAPRQLTFGDRSDGGPSISPDGKWIAFTRRVGGAGSGEGSGGQVWLMPVGGGGEARQLTAIEHGASSPAWAPDGSWLLVTSAIPFSKIEGAPAYDDERPRRAWRDAGLDDDEVEAKPDGSLAEIRKWLAERANERDPHVINTLNFQGERGLSGEDRFAHLFRVDARSGEATQLTDGFVSHGGARLSPDGKTIAFADAPRGETHPDRLRRAVIYMMDADGANARPFLDSERYSFSSPRFAPDGDALYFTYTETESPWGRQTKLARAGFDRESRRQVASAWASHIRGALPTEGGVFFTSPHEGSNPLLFVGANEPERVYSPIHGPEGVGAYDVAGGKIVAAVNSYDRPSRLEVLRADGEGARRVLHDVNPWVQEMDVSIPQERWTTSSDGTRVQYWIMPPTDHDASASYPTVLEIHGGPSSMWGPGESSMWHEFQLLCSFGYGVVFSNPRGSSGYGYEFQAANHRDWGFGPQRDVLAALDAAGSEFAWIDRDRLFITGGSYAGYLTAWVIAQDNRFKAAVAQRGVYDLRTFYGEGNAWRLVPLAFGAYPWDEETQEALTRESPFTWAHQIKTPFLVMHGSNDLRTGVTQSEMLYRALKDMGADAEYIRYPRVGHELSRSGPPAQRMDRLLRIVEFFERYADNERTASAK